MPFVKYQYDIVINVAFLKGRVIGLAHFYIYCGLIT